MGRPKKTKGKGGRKISSGYSLFSPKSRIFYHHVATARSRGQEVSTVTKRTSGSHTVSVPEQEPQGLGGRPPLNPEAGPMSPASLGARKRELGKVNY